jgi:sugar/nucleoside kinase (ribokinase family)
MKRTKIGCAGILVEDIFCGPLIGLPAEGSLTAVSSLPTFPGGCAANVAIDLIKQGAQVDILGCVGDDAGAAILSSRFQKYGIRIEQLHVSRTLPTSRTVILLIEGQDRRYIHVFGANAELSGAHFQTEWLRTLELLYVGGVFVLPGLGCVALAEVLERCRALGVQTVVDVIVPENCAPAKEAGLASMLSQVDYFVPNDGEAQRITGESEPRRQVAALLRLGARNIVVTQGEAGVTAAIGGRLWQAGAYRLAGVDPSGAGDAFASGLIFGIQRGWPVPRMLAYASAVGASATRQVGTTESVFTHQEAMTHIEKEPLSVREYSLT